MPNQPSLLPLENGAQVIAADVRLTNIPGMAPAEGVVLAQLRDGDTQEFVTWRVYLHQGQTQWVASNGDYFGTLEAAVAGYEDRRRGGLPIRTEV